MTTQNEFAPAKLNLYLHITARRADGYHDLDSLVGFASIGDVVRLTPAEVFSFKLEGPQAAALAHEDPEGNLAVKAARSLARRVGRAFDAAMTLVKNLPVASGIGGGSADAAAVLRALARHWGLASDDVRIYDAALEHGQDVPVCLTVQNLYMTAEGTLPAPQLPRVDVVLVNPNRGLSTPLVYQEYRHGGDAFSPPARLLETPTDAAEFIDMLKQRGNDLYAPACRLMPEIAEIIDALNDTPGCGLARMSGSGATCFGLYFDAHTAAAAAEQIRQVRPEWWVEVGILN